MTPEQSYAACMRAIRETLEGAGAVRGVPCQLANVDESDDAIILTFLWEENDGTNHWQDVLIPKPLDRTHLYTTNEFKIGIWIDGKTIYRKVFEINSGLAKDNTIRVGDKPNNMSTLITGKGIIQTNEDAFSNNDILVYVNNSGIFAKQNFTNYPSKLYVIIEYTKE